MCVIPNGIDLSLFRPDPAAYALVRSELGIPSDTVLVGLFARYHPMKDHATFLRAAQIVHSRKKNVQFLLAGKGITANNAELTRTLEEHGLESVVHLLDVRTDIPRLTAALDVACLSSWSESAPFVVCEAMACSVPCVVTNVGDAPRMVGSTGVVVQPRDPEALAEAADRLLTMSVVQRAELGLRAREFALEHYSLQSTVAAYQALYARGPAKSGAPRHGVRDHVRTTEMQGHQ
jgi:glycosyltransferase involved in cell wall biosynthesis